MKHKNRISQLTLELYHRGLATYKERKQVEKALKTDSGVQSRYKALLESEREIREFFSPELRRIEPRKLPLAPTFKRKKVVWGIIAAAVLLCAIIPAFLYLKQSGSNKNTAIAEETAHEIDTHETVKPEETIITENIPVEDKAPEQPLRRERGGSNEKSVIAESPRIEPAPAAEKEFRPELGGTEIASVPAPDTGIRMRGESQTEEPSNLNIPPGLSIIFENMFADKQLSAVVIPGRITSIGKNAFSGNPVVSVTIGANVAVDDNAIPGNFAKAYNSYGKAAGTYTRPDTNSEAWEKK